MKRKNSIYFFVLLLPIIDLITSIQTRINPGGISIGMLIKGIILIISIFYVVFLSSSKYKKISIWYFFIIACFLLLYFGFKIELLNINYLFNEVKYLFRIIYMPIVFVFLLTYFDEYGFDKKLFIVTMIITLIEYTILLITPLLLNIAFESYEGGLGGYVGWFYAANEISVIMVMLLPFIYYLLNIKFKYNILLIIPVFYVITAIGTKVTFLGTIIIAILALIFILVKFGFKYNKYILGGIFILAVTIFFFFFANKITINNVKDLAAQEDFVFVDTPVIDNNQEDIIEGESNDNVVAPPSDDTNLPQNSYTKEFFKKIISFLLSSRDVYYLQTKNIYEATYQFDYPLLGMGFSNTEQINNVNIDKLIEMDYLDLYYHSGLLGLAIVLMPYLYIGLLILKSLFKSMLTKDQLYYVLYNSIIVCMVLGIAGVAGHVLYSPAVSIYLALYLMYLMYYINCFDKKEINPKKVAILSLHLGYGGVEQVITNTANMLCDNYDVEIISLYKKVDEPPFKINKKVKISYLTTLSSNRDEIKIAIKKFNIFRLIKESIKAIYILINKNVWIKKAIINSDAKVLISTRFSFGNLLNKYGRDEVIKIHQEHTYSISEKYINSLYKLKNINYIMPVSRVLCEAYNDKLKDKMFYIPLALNYYPENSETSKLNSRNLIAIGRCEPEKGFDELLEIISELKDENVFLNLFGDGSQLDLLKQKAKELKINNMVKFWGFKNQSFIKKYLQTASLYIMTSHEESFGLVLIEAMSYGVPCIAYDTAQGAKYTINDKNGYYIKNRNQKEMVDSIRKYLKMTSKDKNLMGKEARTTSKEHEYELVKTKWNDFMHFVMENGK